MSSFAKNCLFLLPCSAIAVLIFLKPDIPTIIGIFFKCLLLLSAVIFLINLIGRFKNFFASVRELSSTSPSDDTSLAYAGEISRARKNAQVSYNEQATEYLQSVILPKQEKERKAREEKFYRITGVPWSSPGQALGGNQLISDSLVRQGVSPRKSKDDESNPDSSDSFPTGVNPTNLPEEPEITAPDCITIALKSPLGRTHKRRFLVTDTIELVLRYMATIGYHPSLYGLYLSYPRQSVSENASSSLQELGIVRGTLLNVEEKE